MSVEGQRFDLRDITPQPWKNGAGLTREIAIGGADAVDFDWRISVAEVARDAPFSAFPGIDRCIVLLRGAGMRLHSHDGSIDHRLATPLTPFHFRGEVALDASLIDGASSDFNVMTRRGRYRSELSCHRGAAELHGADATLLFCAEGEWLIEVGAAQTLSPMQGLLWRTPVGAVRVRPSVEPAALLWVRLCHDRL